MEKNIEKLLNDLVVKIITDMGQTPGTIDSGPISATANLLAQAIKEQAPSQNI